MAWQAHFRGWAVALVDRLDPETSSRVAAGLVTPVTGSRGAASWRWNEYYWPANRFYRSTERKTGRSFWGIAPTLKIFANQQECDLYGERWLNPKPEPDEAEIHASLIATHRGSGLLAPFGACSFEPAARLNTQAYLEATKEYFDSLGAFWIADISGDQEINVLHSNEVAVESLDVTAKRLVFCQGIQARTNRFFNRLPLHPARGDILQVESPMVNSDLVVHGSVWSVPIGAQQYLIGATYDRLALHNRVDDWDEDAMRFRSQLMLRWESMTQGTFSTGEHRMVAQRAAVRPASYDRHPLLGQHDEYDNLYCLNGLGSKGTLMAPHLAVQLLDAMEGKEIPRPLIWNRRK
jgi:glycine/D-amino acid oxidase-like deaminating enzyme